MEKDIPAPTDIVREAITISHIEVDKTHRTITAGNRNSKLSKLIRYLTLTMFTVYILAY